MSDNTQFEIGKPIPADRIRNQWCQITGSGKTATMLCHRCLGTLPIRCPIGKQEFARLLKWAKLHDDCENVKR